MRTEILPYQRVGEMARSLEGGKVKNSIQELVKRNNPILLGISFLLGRAVLIGGLMPFGMSIYAATYGGSANRILLGVLVVIGMLTAGAQEQIYTTIAAMILFSAFNIPFRNNKAKSTNLRHGLTAFGSVMLPELIITYLQGFLLYDVLKSLLHGFIVFALVFIYKNATSIISNVQKKNPLSNEEVISSAIIMAIAVSGLSGIGLLGFDIKNVVCILMVLVFSYKRGSGVGSAIGVTVGIIVSMSGVSSPLIIASYAFCGLLAGVLKHLGKLGSALGFIMGNALLTLYINGSTDTLVYLHEIAAATIIFMLIPQRIMESVVARFYRGGNSYLDKDIYSQRVKEITVERLNKFSRAFKELSKTFSEISETKVVTDKQDISNLFDRVADKVCKDCSLCLHCWDRNFYNTYQVMFKIVDRLDSKGRIDENDIPGYFIDRCERVNDFVQAVNNMYEVFKVDMVWKNKIGESRGLVSQQLESLSEIISNLASEVEMDVQFKGEMEDIVLKELNKGGIKASEVIIYENKWGKYEVGIFHKGCGGRRSCLSGIEKTVSDIMGRKMVKASSECYHEHKSDACNLRLVEQEPFKVITGVAKASKGNGAVTGDSYTFMNTGNGRYVLALSDGMGSGQKAATQSRATINLLEQFMESGFDKDTAVKLINSILVLKSDDATFCTIDLSIVDLYKGEVEFVKVGAAPTFIKRADVVETVRSASLPAGILSNVETELIHKKVSSGNFIIMATDGIVDSFKQDDDNEKALYNYIKSIKSTNPQEVADKIIKEAYSRCEGEPIDDMMVVVAKVWKGV
ncbi:MAG: stage II sporulation protein E [Clostridia bacterium]|nr:stage II sporulation protein E [Clostridia bacterium]